MIEGRCTCGALTWRAPAPDFLSTCTCSFCRRSAALWGEADPRAATLSPGDSAREYIRLERALAFVFCGECGNLGWWRGMPGDPDRLKLNFRLADPDAVAQLRRRVFDGADTWRYLE